MEFLRFFALICFMLVGTTANASLPAEEYWNSVLPNTTIPKVLLKLLQPGNVNTFQNMRLSDVVIDRREKYKIYPDLDDGKKTAEAARAKQLATYLRSNTTVFLLFNDLYPGKRFRLLFNDAANNASFLPRHAAELIPFSSNKLQNILNRFSIEPTSVEAKVIRSTIVECEDSNMKGEDRFCPTSLESLVDSIVARLGPKLKVLTQEGSKQEEYTISAAPKAVGDRSILCHKKKYPYAVYYCHDIKATNVYMVPLIGVDGTKAKGIVVCHRDTSAWSPHHLAFQILNVKPGGPPICHFLNTDTLLWIQLRS